MPKIIPRLKYREHCIKQGRDGIKPLTRKQRKALRQHEAAMKEQMYEDMAADGPYGRIS